MVELAKQNKHVAVAQKVVEKTEEEKYIEKNMTCLKHFTMHII